MRMRRQTQKMKHEYEKIEVLAEANLGGLASSAG